MSRVNDHVVAALITAAKEVDQPKEIAEQLIAWLDDLATGNALITDETEAANRISDLLLLVRMSSADDEEDETEVEDEE